MKLLVTILGATLLAGGAAYTLTAYGEKEGEQRKERRAESARREGKGEHSRREGRGEQGGERPTRGVSTSDADKLYALVKQSRTDLRALRQAAGLHAHAAGPHVDPAGHHKNESKADRKREAGERAGHKDREGSERRRGDGRERREGKEGGERRSREGRERREGKGGEHGAESVWIPKLKKHVRTYKNGGRLTLQYNPATQAFVGRVVNTTKKTLSQVRVEIHLSNGVELGPTKRTDLKPGATLPVELSALDQKFTKWVTHPEAGVEKGHGAGGEHSERGERREGRGEHGERRDGRGEKGERREGRGGRREGRGEHGNGRGRRPSDKRLRPVYNQLQLLRGEMRAFFADLKAKKKG